MDAFSRSGGVWRRGGSRTARAALVLVAAVGLVLAACQSLPTTASLSRAAAAEAAGVTPAGSDVVGARAAAAGGVRAAAPPPGGLVESAPLYGLTEGDFSVGEDGSARYTVPLWQPPGRGEARVDLKLKYDSNAGNGPVGVGWTLDGLSSITPCPRNFAIDGRADGVHFDGTDAYCLDGNRLLPLATSGAEREFRTEKETFARIVGYGMGDGVPDSFRVWSKDGLISTYGEYNDSAKAQLRGLKLEEAGTPQDPTLEPESDTPVTVAWALNRVEDRNGNTATVEYELTSGDESTLWHAELLPKAVKYAPNRVVEFSYADRDDPIDTFIGGLHTRISKRLSRIRMSGGPHGGNAEVLRDYQLSYQNNSITGRSLLSEVREFDQDGVAKMPQTFLYARGSYDIDVRDTNVTVDGSDIKDNYRLTVGDVDGDGRDDLIYPDAENEWKMRLSTGTGFGPEQDSGIPNVSPDETSRIRPTDVDRDGRVDVMAEVQIAAPPGQPIDRKDLRLYTSNGEKFVATPVDVDEERADEEPEPVYFTDIDGNGTPDYLSATYDQEDGTEEGQGRWYYRLNTGKVPHARWQPTVVTDDTDPANIGLPLEAVDLDGDGKGWVARGDYADLNGDGLPDWIAPAYETVPEGEVDPEYALRVRVNSGNGLGPRTDSPQGYRPPVYSGTVTGQIPNSVRYADFDNDGADDLLVLYPSYPDDPPSEGAQLWVWRKKQFVKAPFAANVGFHTPNGMATAQPLDLNGDDLLDLVYFEDDNLVTRDGHLKVAIRKGEKPDLMTSGGILPIGQRVEIDYTTLADRTVVSPGQCDDSFPVICPQRGGSVVSEHRVANPEVEGSWSRFIHRWEGARSDVQGRGSLAFAKHIATGIDLATSTSTEYNNVTREGGTEGVPAVYPFAGLPKTVTTVVGTPGLPAYRKTVTNTHELRRLESGGHTVELAKSVETEYERPPDQSSWPAPFRIRTTDVDYDGFGNKTKVSKSTGFGRRTTVDTTYNNVEANWLIGLKRQSTVMAAHPVRPTVPSG